MQVRSLRLFSIIFASLLALVVGLPWFQAAMAQPHVADFTPTHTPREAAARVALARAKQTAYRQAATDSQSAVDANQLPYVPIVYFPDTGHHLSNRAGFLDFWRANGQVLIFGYPITEEFIEDGRLVQYFERARLEYHPEVQDPSEQVQLGLIGRELMGDRGELQGVADPQNGWLYFPETQHALYGEFLQYWERRGGLGIFGFPITEAFEENGRIVQYFERARFVYNPEDMAAFYRNMEQYKGITLNTLHEVELDTLGRQLAQARGIDTTPIAQLPGAAAWTPELWARHIEVNLSTQWLTAYENDIVVYRAPVATGRNGFNTPTGNYAIYNKLQMQTMTGSMGGESWNVPDVPWVMYVVGGVALHGTYWHNAFGTGVRMSHGCINLGIDDAQWLYQWADIGTTVAIHY
jgi:hypothetical protein